MEWAEASAKPGSPPLTESAFEETAQALGFRDRYRETSSFLYYVLTQKLANSIIAIEILREIKDKCGLKSWSALCKEYERTSSPDLLSKHNALVEVKPLRDLRTLACYLRNWEHDMAELVAHGGEENAIPDRIRRSLLVQEIQVPTASPPPCLRAGGSIN